MRIARRNLAEAGAVSATSSETGYPASCLVDGDTTRPWIAAADATDVALRVDLDAFQGAGGFEDWAAGVPVEGDGDEFGEDRSTGTGSTTEETTHINGGSSALKLTCTTGARRRVFRVSEISGAAARAGEVWTVEAYLRGDGTGAAQVGVYDPITAKWWDPAGAGAWTTTETYFGARATASYAVAAATVTIDGWAAHQVEDVDLEVHLVCDDAGQVAYFDDLAAWPHWDLVILHGHNVTPGLGVELRANNASSWADASAFQEDAFKGDAFQQGSGELVAEYSGVPRRPACYLYLATVQPERYLEVKFPGTHPTRVYLGALWVGQTEESVEYPLLEQPLEWAALQSRVRAGRRQHVASYAADAARSIAFTVEVSSLDDLDRFRGIWEGQHYGARLVAVVPSTDEPTVYIGRFAEALAPRRFGLNAYRLELLLAEDGFPTVA